MISSGTKNQKENHRSFTDKIIVNTGNGHGSTNTMIRRFTTTQFSSGSAITYADSATLGASFTINATGFYFIQYTDNHLGSSILTGISKNTTQPTTQINTITAANRLFISGNWSSNNPRSTEGKVYLQKGDVIRPHTTGVNTSVNVRTCFEISRINN